MQIHDLKSSRTRKRRKVVGRGGKRGKTSGKGHKGQKARAGGTPRPELRDIIKKMPKRRGYKFSYRAVKPAGISVAALSIFEDGATVTPGLLVESKLVSRQGGKVPAVKLLGTGELDKKLTLEGFLYTKAALEKVNAAGCTVKESK